MSDDDNTNAENGARTFTQDELNAILATEKRRHRDELARFSDYDTLKETVTSLTGERDSLTSKATDAESRAKAAEVRALQFEVAATVGLPPAFAARLSGSTREELERDAQSLRAVIPAATPTALTAPPVRTAPKGSRAAAAMREMRMNG